LLLLLLLLLLILNLVWRLGLLLLNHMARPASHGVLRRRRRGDELGGNCSDRNKDLRRLIRSDHVNRSHLSILSLTLSWVDWLEHYWLYRTALSLGHLHLCPLMNLPRLLGWKSTTVLVHVLHILKIRRDIR
jgi:hypothetical protein